MAPAGEDTAFAPLIPDILSALEGSDLQRLEAVGRTYVERMRGRVPGGRNVTHIVDKMLRYIMRSLTPTFFARHIRVCSGLCDATW